MVKRKDKPCSEAKSKTFPRKWENEDINSYFPSSMRASLANYEVADKAIVSNLVQDSGVSGIDNSYIMSTTCNAADILKGK